MLMHFCMLSEAVCQLVYGGVLVPVLLTYLTVPINNEELKIKNERQRKRKYFGFIWSYPKRHFCLLKLKRNYARSETLEERKFNVAKASILSFNTFQLTEVNCN